MHEITGHYENAWGQPTVTCACGWNGDNDRQHENHLLEEARKVELRTEHEAKVGAAKKALKVK